MKKAGKNPLANGIEFWRMEIPMNWNKTKKTLKIKSKIEYYGFCSSGMLFCKHNVMLLIYK